MGTKMKSDLAAAPSRIGKGKDSRAAGREKSAPMAETIRIRRGRNANFRGALRILGGFGPADVFYFEWKPALGEGLLAEVRAEACAELVAALRGARYEAVKLGRHG